MPITDRATLKGYFLKGAKPSQTDFANLIDSFLNLADGSRLFIDQATGNIGIGTTTPQAKLQVVGGAIMPSASTAQNDENSGILFPRDPFGPDFKALDRAYIRYYSRGGPKEENMTLEIGTSNDTDDHIALMTSGNVGIGTNNPVMSLQVNKPSLHGAPALGGYMAGADNNNGWLYFHTVGGAGAEHSIIWDDSRPLRFGVEPTMGGDGYRAIAKITPNGYTNIQGTNYDQMSVSGAMVANVLNINYGDKFLRTTFETSSTNLLLTTGGIYTNTYLRIDYPEDYSLITTGRIMARGAAFPGSDFAELFESDNKKIIPIGTSIVLTETGKIKSAKPDEIPIGVVASVTALVLNSYNDWPQKYLKNEFGQNLTEEVEEEYTTPDGKTERAKVAKPILNPDYDPNREYVPRDQRPEWHPVGLLGQLHLRKGQPVAPTWVKIKDVSDNVELWLVK